MQQQAVRLALALLLLWQCSALAQGQRISGDRTMEGGFNAGTATGAVNTYALTLTPALTAYLDRQCYLFKANLANTGTATLNVNGLGAKTLQKRVAGVATALAANDIGAGQYVYACYDGTNMQVIPMGNFAAGAGTGDALTTQPLSQFAATTSAQLAAVLSDEVGATGGFLRSGGNAATATALAVDPTACGAGLFVTDIAANGTLTCGTPAGGGNVSATGSPTAGLTAEWTSGTVIQGIGSSGSGLYVKQTNTTLIAPALGVATATSLNKVTITAPATSATLQIADLKSLIVSNTMTFLGTDSAGVNVGAGGLVAYRNGTPTINQLATWASASNLTAVTALPAANMPALTGDVTTVAGALGTTLATVNANVGSFTGTKLTVNAKGLITAASSALSLGLGVAEPAATGALSQTAAANAVTLQTIKRFTDTAPTGNFQLFQTAAAGTLWQVDIAGILQAGTVPMPRVPPIVTTVATGVTLACDVSASTLCSQSNTQATGTLTLSTPTGTPADFQAVTYRVTCTNSQTYAYASAFAFSTDLPAPVSCLAGTTDLLSFRWSSTTSKFQLIGALQGF